MIYEPRHVAFESWVDDFAGSELHHVGASGLAVHLETILALLRVEVYHFSDVLDDELTLFNFFSSDEPETLAPHGFGIHTSIFVQLEVPVLAVDSTGASPLLALGGHVFVYALGPTIHADIRVVPLLARI